MPFIRKIEARVYARATEITERVATAVLNIFPEEVRKNVSISEEKAEGQSGDTISILSGELIDTEECEITFDFIFKHMDKKDRRTVIRSLDLRFDDNCVFFLRIDKQGAFLGKIRMANNTDIIQTRFYFRNSPRCRKKDAMMLIERRIQHEEA